MNRDISVLLGRRQAVRHRILVPAFGGSNPPVPAIALTVEGFKVLNTIVHNDISSFCVFSGNSNPVLAEKVCGYLDITLGRSKIGCFSDGEIQVEVYDNVEGKDVFIIQSTCRPVNRNLLELLLLLDALKRASAHRVTAVIPYYGYARQDRKVAPIAPISAKLVADLLTTAGVNKVITVDLHAGQIQGFFNVPVDDVCALPIICDHISSNFSSHDIVIVSPDAGGINRARLLAKHLNCGVAIVDKHRLMPNKAVATNVVGNVSGKIAIIQDDMIDTAGTLTEATRVIHKLGVGDIHVYCTHPVMSDPAVDRITKSPISSLTVTDTIPLIDSVACNKIKVLSVSSLLGEAISRSFTGKLSTSPPI